MADLFNELLGSLDSLSENQIAELMARLEAKKSGSIQNAKEKGLMIEDGKVIACPHCGSVEIVRHGHKDDKQRYRCKDCGKTFMLTTDTMFHRSRLNSFQWRKLLEGMVQNLSLKEIAKTTGIHPSAVWYNKQKVLDMLAEKFHKQDTFTDIVECDEYSVHLSFKGKRDPNFFINVLGRMPKHHRSLEKKRKYLEKNGLLEELERNLERLEMLLTGDTYVRGTNKDSVCILTGKDRNGHLYIAPVCVGSLESEHVVKHLSGRFPPDAILVTDSNNAYNWFAEYGNIHHEQILASKHANGPYNLGRINALHSKLAAFWPDMAERLPATKYLDLNLMLFWWLEKNSNLNTPEQVEILYQYVSGPLGYETTYDSLIHRYLNLDTKGLIPEKV